MFEGFLRRFGYEKKESRVLPTLITLGLDTPVWTPRDYEQLAKVGYQTNADVYACINLIIRSARQIPWLVSGKEGGTAVKENHPLLKLLRKPNEYGNESDFKESVLGYLMISGNAYIERSGGSEGGPPVFLYSHRPDRIKVIKGNRRTMIGGYEYKAGGEAINFEPWEMLHLRLYNPLDDWYGMSPLEAAAYTIDTSNEASALYKRLLQKGYPPGAVTIRGGAGYTDQQVRDLKMGLKRAADQGEVLVLQDAEWKEMGYKPVDGALNESKLSSKRDIAAVFGVPSGMVGDTQVKTYANSREERRSLYTEAVIPALTKLRDALNNWLSPLYDGAYIDFDKDSIDALAEDRDTQATRVKTLFEVGLIKRSEGRDELKYDAVPEEEDGYYADVSKPAVPDVPEAAPLAIEGPNAAGAEDGQPAGAKKPTRSLTVVASNGKKHYEPTELRAFNLLSEEQKDNHAKAFEERRELWYERVQDDVSERFQVESNVVLKAYRDGGEGAALKAVTKQEPAWEALYKRIYLAVTEDFGRRTIQGLKADGYDIQTKLGMDLFTETVLNWIATEGAKRVVGVTDTTKEQIRKELAAGTAAGEGTFELSKRLQGMYVGFDNIRSERISRTEVISASNLGSHAAAEATNLPLNKEWLATFDRRTRDAHAHAHGQKQRMDQPFIVMGQKLMFPGDSSMGASGNNLIQCRCTQVYEVRYG